MATTKKYSADDIKTLDQITHVRKRVGMYLGSNSDQGITVAARELIDNGVDEVLGGHGTQVEVTFYEDGSTEVADHGRGLPIDKNSDGVNGIILTVGTIGSGGKFGGKDISGGLNGVGASATNATAARFDVTVYRDGNKYQLSFKEGRPGFFAKADDPSSVFKESTEIKVSKDDRAVGVRKAHPSGTVIRFWPDYTVFIPGSRPVVEDLKGRLKATAFLISGFTGVVNDLRDPKNPVRDTFHFNAGLVDMLPTLSHHALVVKPIHLTGDSSFSELTNVLQENGQMKQEEVVRPVNVDVAFGFTNTEDTVLNSYVNIIQTKQGGSHESGLWRALSRVIVNQVKATRGLLKAKEEAPTLEDVRDGFVGVISIKFPEPTFTGQSKEALATPQVTSVVSQTVGDLLKSWFDNKRNAAQAKLVLQKVVEAKRIREAAKLQKDTARKKTALESAASMPAKLVECERPGDVFAELHIAEGDSALGTLRSARDSRFQALLPIRGKILNTQKATIKQVLDNAECAGIIQVLGAGSGKSFDISQLRYQNIFLAVDADVDGAHIRSLLITLFWNWMPELVRQGRLFASEPPLYILKTIGRNSQIHYLQSDEERDALLAKLKKAGTKHDPLQRLKGLGEMNADEFWDTTLNPETRTVRRITVEDAEAASTMVELAMGSKVEPRKDWIMSSRSKLSENDLDL